jgi:hypothetical protein
LRNGTIQCRFHILADMLTKTLDLSSMAFLLLK